MREDNKHNNSLPPLEPQMWDKFSQHVEKTVQLLRLPAGRQSHPPRKKTEMSTLFPFYKNTIQYWRCVKIKESLEAICWVLTFSFYRRNGGDRNVGCPGSEGVSLNYEITRTWTEVLLLSFTSTVTIGEWLHLSLSFLICIMEKITVPGSGGWWD